MDNSDSNSFAYMTQNNKRKRQAFPHDSDSDFENNLIDCAQNASNNLNDDRNSSFLEQNQNEAGRSEGIESSDFNIQNQSKTKSKSSSENFHGWLHLSNFIIFLICSY